MFSEGDNYKREYESCNEIQTVIEWYHKTASKSKYL